MPLPLSPRRFPLRRLLLPLALLLTPLAWTSAATGAAPLGLSAAERAWLAAHPVVNIRVSRDYPPFEFFADGRYQGIAVDYLKLVEQRLGITFRPVEGLSWPQSLDEVKRRGQVDAILLITRTREREADFAFTRDYVSFPWVVFTHKDAPVLRSLSALDGKTIAVERGYIAGEWLKRDLPGIRLFEVTRTLDALEAVMLGHADAYLGNLAVGSYLIGHEGLVDLKVAGSTPEEPDSLAMGVRGDWPELAGMIDRVLAEMSEEEHLAIRQKWLAIRYEHGITRADVFMWLSIVTGFALLWVGWLWQKVRGKRVALQAEVALREERERQLAGSLREVKAAHHRLEQLIAGLPLGYMEWDRERCIQACNPEAERLTGWRREEILGRSLYEIGVIPPESGASLRALGDGLFAGAIGARRVVSELVRRDGERRRGELHVAPRLDETGGVCSVIAIFADITDRLRLEEQLVQSEKMLSVGGLAAGLAHEINNPLAGVLQNLQVARQRLNAELARNREVAGACGLDLAALACYLEQREVNRMLEAIGESAERAASIVHNMLNFSRKSLSRPVPSDLRELLDKALALAASDYDLKKKYDFRKIEIIRDYAAELPLVGCEPGELQQVFLNLLKNAAQAMADKVYPDGERPRLLLRIAPVAGGVQVEVEDNGPGMPEEVRRRVFEPFFTTKETGAGTGLGLSVAYFIVSEHHHGNLDVRTRDGAGCTFTVVLPATAAADGES